MWTTVANSSFVWIRRFYVFNHDYWVVMNRQTWGEWAFIVLHHLGGVLCWVEKDKSTLSRPFFYQKTKFSQSSTQIISTPEEESQNAVAYVKDCCSALSLIKFLKTIITFSLTYTHSYSQKYKYICWIIMGLWALKQPIPRLIIVAAAITPWSELPVASSVNYISRKVDSIIKCLLHESKVSCGNKIFIIASFPQ